MTLQSKRELIQAIRRVYRKASKKQKSQHLDHLELVTELKRNYLNRLLLLVLARKKIGHLKSKRSATHSQKDRPPCGKVPGCPSNHIWGGVNGQKKEPTGRSAPDGEGAKRTAAI